MTDRVHKIAVIGCPRHFFNEFIITNYVKRLESRGREIKGFSRSGHTIRFEMFGTIFKFYHISGRVTDFCGNIFKTIYVGDWRVEDELVEHLEINKIKYSKVKTKPAIIHNSPDYFEVMKIRLEKRKVRFLGELGT